MFKKTMTYTDYSGNERTEDFYFNLTKAECLKLQMSTDGGMDARMQRIIAAQDMPTMMTTFESIILAAYGEKSPDGKRFIKTPEIVAAFSQTEAYSDLFIELCTNAEAAVKFCNTIVPQGEAGEAVISPQETVNQAPVTQFPQQ